MEISDAKLAEYQRGYRAEREALVGRYFKHIECARDEPSRSWPVYIAATGLDAHGRLIGWHFQQTPKDQIEIAPEVDLPPRFVTEMCYEVARGEFVTAFNELLTEVARFATRMPQG